MSDRLQSAYELAKTMSHRWGVNDGPKMLGPPHGVSARCLEAPESEVDAEPSDAVIMACILGGGDHEMWYGSRHVHSGRTPTDSVTLVPIGTKPRALIKEPIKVMHLYLPRTHLRKVASEMGHCEQDIAVTGGYVARDPALNWLCRKIVDELPNDETRTSLYRDSLVNTAVTKFLRDWCGLGQRLARPSRGGLAPWQLRRACEAMAEHLHADIGLDDLAKVAGCSPTHFSRAFKQSTGMPPFQWLNERRIERAKYLLAETRLSLAEIALAVGFSAQPQFTTAFGRATGTTPGAWRRERLM